MQSVFIIGADGTIGSALANSLELEGQNVWRSTRRRECASGQRLYLDLSEPTSNRGLPVTASSAVICAGETSTATCALRPSETRVINVDSTEVLAKQLVAKGMRVVYLSTNQVFDGSIAHRKSEDPTCPPTEYGRQKAAAEHRLLALGNKVVVVRLTKVLHKDFALLTQWNDSLLANKPIHPFSDMVLSPVPLNLVTDVITRLIDIECSGIFQISGPEDITYEELARYLAKRIGANQDLVQPIKSIESELHIDHVPAHSTLDTTRLQRALSVVPPSVWSTVDSALLQPVL